MSMNNSIGFFNYKYYFLLQMTSSHADVTGDGITEYHVPYTKINDAWNIYNETTNLLTIPAGGKWIMGMSVKYSANYADFFSGNIFGATTSTASNMVVGFSYSSPISSATDHVVDTFGGSPAVFLPSVGDQYKCVYFVAQSVPALNAGLIADAAWPTYWWGYLLLEAPFTF